MSVELKPQKIIYLDRDGVLCEYRDYLSKMQDFHILPESLKALKILKEKGYQVFVLTNQPMLARGLMAETLLLDMHDLLMQAARMAGGQIEKVFFCPHTPGPLSPGYVPELVGDCDCRKPKIGLFSKAEAFLKDKGLRTDKSQSWMVGDSWRDILLGKNAGLRTAGIKGIPKLEDPQLTSRPDLVASNLLEIVDQICR